MKSFMHDIITIIEYIIKVWAIVALINPKYLPFVENPTRLKAFITFIITILVFRLIAYI